MLNVNFFFNIFFIVVLVTIIVAFFVSERQNKKLFQWIASLSEDKNDLENKLLTANECSKHLNEQCVEWEEKYKTELEKRYSLEKELEQVNRLSVWEFIKYKSKKN